MVSSDYRISESTDADTPEANTLENSPETTGEKGRVTLPR